MLGQTVSLWSKKSIDFLSGTTEGGAADIYHEKGKLKAIFSKYYGETGKTEINYFFANDIDGKRSYLVDVTDYNYVSPVQSNNKPTLASMITSKFFVCEGVKPDYPNSTDLTSVYTRSVDALTVILEKANQETSD